VPRHLRPPNTAEKLQGPRRPAIADLVGLIRLSSGFFARAGLRRGQRDRGTLRRYQFAAVSDFGHKLGSLARLVNGYIDDQVYEAAVGPTATRSQRPRTSALE
jgi:hypothetical protein